MSNKENRKAEYEKLSREKQVQIEIAFEKAAAEFEEGLKAEGTLHLLAYMDAQSIELLMSYCKRELDKRGLGAKPVILGADGARANG